MTDTGSDGLITVSVTPTFAEYLRFNWWGLLRRARLLVVIGFFSLAVFLAAPILPHEGDTVAAKYLQVLPALILPAFVFIFIPVITYWAVRRRWQTASALRESRIYTFSDAGVHVAGETFESSLAWSNITSVERVGGQVLLGTAQQQFFLVPVSAFGDGDMLARFFRLVTANVSRCHL